MKLSLYRVLSFLLLPMAILFSVSVLLFIRAAFSNPPIFIELFFAASISIYTYASLNFIIRGIDSNKLLGKSSKEWLIVNAIVSIIYSLLAIFQRIMLFMQPAIIENFADTAKRNAGDALKLNHDQLIQYIIGISYFLVVYGIVLFIHIIITFQYIKQYRHLFQNQLTE